MPLRTLAFVTIKAERVVLVLVDGTELTARPSESLVSVAARLAAHPPFVRAQNGYLVNLDLVDRITRTGQGDMSHTSNHRPASRSPCSRTRKP